MSTKSDNTPERDELGDRLVDAALREVVGGMAPPDLSERIISLIGMDERARLAGNDAALHLGRFRRDQLPTIWKVFAIAAMVAIAAVPLLLPHFQADREAARRADAPALDQLGVRRPEEARSSVSGSTPPLPSQLERSKRTPQRVESLEKHPQAVLGGAERTAPVPGNDGPLYAGVPYQFSGQPKLPAQAPNHFEAEAVATVSEPISEEAAEAIDGQDQLGRGQVALAPPAGSRQDDDGALQAEGVASVEVQNNEVVSGPKAIASNLGFHSLYNDAYGVPHAGEYGAQKIGNSTQMMITPGIIINESEENRLGIHDLSSSEHLYGESGRGPGLGGDKYARIVENPFKAVSAANTDNRLSTFSIDVDTASYANVRQFLRDGTLPPPDAVRIEELVNYFDYDYTPPTGEVPFAAHIEVAGCPWAPKHRLVRVGIKGREIERTARPKSNLVFLVDVSGSMDEPNKLPLLVDGLRMVTRELGENDRVAIVVYASSEGLALESTPGTKQSKILAALDQLAAGGSTAGGAGIQLAYKVAAENFIKGGVNRVILCTDGDFNVGVTSPAALERMAAEQANETGVFLTVLGFGRGNLNDAMMEQVADKGNGNYHYVDSRQEARKVLVEEMSGTLVTIAKDVKLQVEFNPAQVAGYRLIGYENRMMAAEDFNDDAKDAGEIGAGHTVTALYEVAPAGENVDTAEMDGLRYAAPKAERAGEIEDKSESEAASDELLTLKIRYKAPDEEKSSKLEFPVEDGGQPFAKASDDFKFSAAVASFGMLLRDSKFKGNATYAAAAEIAEAASNSRDPHGYRKEFVELVSRAMKLSGE